VIVSHEHRFVFLKTRKTAGTSVEVFLSPLAGPDAIVTPVAPAESGHLPRNSEQWFNPIPEIRRKAMKAIRERNVRTGLRATARDLLRREAFQHHMTAQLARERLGEEVWQSYFKFAFERNPWDKAVSLYFWLYRDEKDAPRFDDWVSSRPRELRSDWPIYNTLDGSTLDFVGRYEHLERDLREIVASLGLANPGPVPRAKSGVRPTRASVSMCRDSVDFIAEEFRREVDRFGYEVPDMPGRIELT